LRSGYEHQGVVIMENGFWALLQPSTNLRESYFIHSNSI